MIAEQSETTDFVELIDQIIDAAYGDDRPTAETLRIVLLDEIRTLEAKAASLQPTRNPKKRGDLCD